MTTEPSLADQVEALFWVDGPHSADKTRDAAASIAHLVRYLCHATYSDNAVPYPSTVNSVTHSLHAAVVGFDQLLRQLDQRLDGLAATGRLYDDEGGDPYARVDQWSESVAAARGHLANAAHRLQWAAGRSSHLGLRTDEEEGR